MKNQLTEKIVKSRKEKGEVVGGGYIIFRRGKRTGRLGVKKYAIIFEHPSMDAALAEVERLTILNPGEKFVVFKEVSETIYHVGNQQ